MRLVQPVLKLLLKTVIGGCCFSYSVMILLYSKPLSIGFFDKLMDSLPLSNIRVVGGEIRLRGHVFP